MKIKLDAVACGSDECITQKHKILRIETIMWNSYRLAWKDTLKRIKRLHTVENEFELRHIGYDPLQFIIHCKTHTSLHNLVLQVETGDLAEDLRREALRITTDITGLKLNTHISSLEISMCARELCKSFFSNC